MNEHDILKKSIKVCIIGIIIFSIIGLCLKSISYPLGFLLGYIINVVVFCLIIKMSDFILNLKQSTSLIILLNILKLFLYALGFLVAIFFKDIFSLVGVFFGYMVTKITIHIVAYKSKGGEVGD